MLHCVGIEVLLSGFRRDFEALKKVTLELFTILGKYR